VRLLAESEALNLQGPRSAPSLDGDGRGGKTNRAQAGSSLTTAPCQQESNFAKCGSRARDHNCARPRGSTSGGFIH